MRIAHVASEVAPWSHTGGLADVAGALPTALERASGGAVSCAVFSPLYRGIRHRAEQRGASVDDHHEPFAVNLGGMHFEVRVVTVREGARAPVHFLDVPALFDRAGVYADEHHRDYADNGLRFAVLARAAVAAAPALMGAAPDVWHGHDWQAGLLPLFARAVFAGVARPALVFTIHNLAYRGLFGKDIVPALGLDWSAFTHEAMEFHDLASFLKAGVAYADAVTTVSPSYAEEIKTPEHGHGLDGFLLHNAARLHGIVNGIDTESWNPATDPSLAERYEPGALQGKRRCRAALAAELDLELGERELLIGMVTRFAEQKGLDLVADVAPQLERLGAGLVVLGTGEPALQDRFRALAARLGRRVAVRIDFDLRLARRIYAGSDALLMPSRFEPCGLNQLYAMRYGTVPIVRAVGGLRDTVDDPGDDALLRGEGTGIRFEDADAGAVSWAVGRAARLFREHPDGWQRLVRSAMARDWSWAASARKYLDLYEETARAAAR